MPVEYAEIGSGGMPTVESVKFASLKRREIFCQNHPRYWRVEARLGTVVIDGFETFNIDNPL